MARGGTFIGKLTKATWYRWNRRRVVSRLRDDGGPACAALAAALAVVSPHGPSGEEKGYIDAIESIRRELNESTARISLRDLGAGSAEEGAPEPRAERTPEYRTVGEMSSRASQPPLWAYLLFRIIRETKPARCLELGTAFGISAAYQAAALELNGAGTLVTLEGAEPLADIAERIFERLAADRIVLKRGRFEDILAAVLAEFSPIDFAFIDGHHDEQATVRYFTEILPCLSDGAVLVFDDIAWSEGMKRAWHTISTDERIATSIDLFKLGICTAGGSPRGKKRSYKTSID